MKKWKWNWGTGLAIALAVFVLGMTLTMFKVSQQRFDLVTTDYYEEELAYQETIDRKQAALQLKDRAELSFKDGRVVLSLPQQLHGKAANVEVKMYCQTDARNDFILNEKDWPVKNIEVPSSKLKPGKWIAKVTLDLAEAQYYFDPDIVIL